MRWRRTARRCMREVPSRASADRSGTGSRSSTPAASPPCGTESKQLHQRLVAERDHALSGGAFTSVGGQTRNRIAALDVLTGNATAWDPKNANNAVYALGLSGSRLYAGGLSRPSASGPQPRRRVQRLDRGGDPLDPNANSTVSALAVKRRGRLRRRVVYQHWRAGAQSPRSTRRQTGLAYIWNPNAKQRRDRPSCSTQHALRGRRVHERRGSAAEPGRSARLHHGQCDRLESERQQHRQLPAIYGRPFMRAGVFTQHRRSAAQPYRRAQT